MGRGSLRIELLGELRVLHDGKAVALPASRRTRALFGYLVATGHPHTRERLCELLWEGPDDPRAALRWSLSKLRPLVDGAGAQRLRADRERVAFEPHGATVDRAELLASLAGGIAGTSIETLRRAASSFRGEFLEDLELPDCYRYREWQVAERASLRQTRLATLAALSTRLADPEEALSFARARVMIDPLSEEAHAEVVELLGRLGRLPEAVAQYETFRRILDHELGTAPSPKLQHARARLGSLRAPPRAAPSAEPPPEKSATEELIGRAVEREAMLRAVEEARDGKAPSGLLFLGDPGIGKTRLLHDFAAAVTRAGGRTIMARAHEAERIRPYGPFIDAFASLPIGDLPAPLRPELGALLATGQGARRGGKPEHLHDAVATLLGHLARREPLLLAVDDVQWLDESSAALLHFLARTPPRSTLFACAARSGELSDNARALRVVRALLRAGRLTQRLLEPLDEDETTHLIRALGAEVDPAIVYRESRGNPLYAVELAVALVRGAASAPPTLDALIEDRLERLPERARDLIPWIAAIGTDLRLPFLTTITGRGAADVLSAIEDLERYRIVEAGERSYEFVHDMVRRVAYRRISPPRRQLIHLSIARALALEMDRDGAVAGLVVRHASEAGAAELCAAACVRAGERAIDLCAYDNAEAMVGLGRYQAQRLPDSVRIRLDMRLLKLLEQPALRRCAIRLRGEIARLCVEAKKEGLNSELRSGLELLGWVHLSEEDLGQSGWATSAINALARLPRDNLHSLVEGARCLAILEVDPPRAKAMFADLERFGPAVIETLLFQWGVGVVKRWEGDAAGARVSLRNASRLAHEANDPFSEFECLALLVILELEEGRPDDALGFCVDLRSSAEAVGPGGSEGAFADALQSLAELSRGQPEADGHIALAVRELERLDAAYLLAGVRGSWAQIALGRGDISEADRQAHGALQAARVVPRPGEETRAHALLAQMHAAAGRAEEARREIESARACGAQFLSARTRATIREVEAVLRSLEE